MLAERGEIAGGSTGKAMGGIRQQFSTAAEVRLAQESIRFFEELGPRLFEQVGYLFLATTEEGLAALAQRRSVQRRARRAGRGRGRAPRSRSSPPGSPRTMSWAAPSARPTASPILRPSPRELVRRAAELGVDVREGTAGEDVEGDVRVLACGAWSAEAAARYGVELPVRPLCRQLIDTTPVAGLPERLPMVLEAETGFHFRRRGDRLRLAMTDPAPRWGFAEIVDESLLPDRLERLARRFPPAAEAGVGQRLGRPLRHDSGRPSRSSAGSRPGVYAACGFSGHGFMQSPAVGRAVAEELVEGASALDLSPYRLERFASGAVFPEQVVL